MSICIFTIILIVIFLNIYSVISCNNALDCWLDSLVIGIPDQCSQVLLTECCSQHLTCSHSTISKIKSKYMNPLAIMTDIDGLRVECQGNWKCGWTSGKLSAIIKNTNIATTMTVGKSDLLPTSVGSSSCSVTRMDVDINFSGSVASHVLELFSSILDSYVQDKGKKELCKKFGDELAKNGTDVIVQMLDPAALALISSAPDPVPHMEGYISWNNSLLGPLFRMGNRWIPSDTVALLVDAVTNNTGSLSLDLQNETFNIPITRTLPLGLRSTSTSEGAIPRPALKTDDSHRLSLDRPLRPVRADDRPDYERRLVGNLSITIRSVSVSGLRSLYGVQWLRPSLSSNISVVTALRARRLRVSIDVSILVIPARDAVMGPRLRERFTLSVLLANASFGMDVVAAADPGRNANLFVDQVYGSKGLCLLTALDVLSLSSLRLNATIAEMGVVDVQGSSHGVYGLLEKDLDVLINNTLRLATNDFRDLLTSSLSGLFQGPVRRYANKKLDDLRLSAAASCPIHQVHNLTTWLQWADVFPKHLPKNIESTVLNRVVDWRTSDTGQVGLHEAALDAVISGLDSFFSLTAEPWGPVENTRYEEQTSSNRNIEQEGSAPAAIVADTSAGCLLALGAAVGRCFGGTCPDLSSFRNSSLSLAAAVTVPTKGPLPLHAAVSLIMTSFGLSAVWDARVNRDTLMNLRLGNLQETGCLASTVDALSLLQLEASAVGAQLWFDSLPLGHRSAEVLAGLLALLGSPLSRSLINANIEATLASLSSTCSASNVMTNTSDNEGHSESGWWWVARTPVIVCAILLVLCVAVFVWFVVSRRCSWLNFSSYGVLGEERKNENEDEAVCGKYALMQVESEAETGSRSTYRPSLEVATSGLALAMTGYDPKVAAGPRKTTPKPAPRRCSTVGDGHGRTLYAALVQQPTVPLLVRIAVPMLILVNMALFVWASSSVGANVRLRVQAGGVTVDMAEPVFQFSLMGTVRDMFRAGVYTLGILIVVFSGALPYVKLVAMMGSMCLSDSSGLHFHRREVLLTYLDLLSKWSLIDLFVMVMMICAFYLRIVVSEEVIVVLHVEPGVGFYAFQCATMLSLVLGHTVLACHRAVFPVIGEGVPDPVEGSQSCSRPSEDLCAHGDAESLSSHQFTAQVGRGPGHAQVSVSVSRLGVVLVTALLGTLFLALCLGLTIDTFRFKYLGLISYFLGEGEGGRSAVSFSFLSVLTTLPAASGQPHQLGVWFIVSSMVLFGVVMPLLTVLSLAVLWLAPLRAHTQRRLVVVAETLNAWSAIDVFALSTAVGVVEIRRFAAFMIGSSCDAINDILRPLSSSGGPWGSDSGLCFDIHASVLPGAWTLFLAAALFAVLSPFLLSLAARATSARLAGGRRCVSPDDRPGAGHPSGGGAGQERSLRAPGRTHWSLLCLRALRLVEVRQLQ